MDRVAVFVDAGYLFAQGSVLLAGSRQPRGHLVIHHTAAIQSLAAFAQAVTGLSLLRIYWYDGTSTGPTAQHLAFANHPNVKVRLGFVNSVGEQKGVDSLIVTDMIDLARNRAMADAVLLSGDEDLRVGVQQAQALGVRVHLLGIKPGRGTQSQFLMQEADTVHEWAEVELKPWLSIRETTTLPAPLHSGNATTPVDAIRQVVEQVAAALPIEEVHSVLEQFRSTRQIPREIDGRLLSRSRARLGFELSPELKRVTRTQFILTLEALNAEPPPRS